MPLSPPQPFRLPVKSEVRNPIPGAPKRFTSIAVFTGASGGSPNHGWAIPKLTTEEGWGGRADISAKWALISRQIAAKSSANIPTRNRVSVRRQAELPPTAGGRGGGF